ncbi:lipocalin family protein [Aegicerativicinus sediminis]|uniref:lipocalin family protein n=1 Tax=Aegicerativicinus sediminis TaxID=2893202 RepID=UPI001E3615FD|nr:lipocalin family protein [Aegicerativicinus sediminis]
MKYFAILMSFIISGILVSCSSDDGNNSKITSSIEGEWTASDLDYSGTTTFVFNGETINVDFVGEAYDMNNTLVFNSNPNTVISSGYYSIELTFKMLGEEYTETAEDLEFLEDGTWSLSGDKLTVINGDESTVMLIKELTEHRLILIIEEEEIIDLEEISSTAKIKGVLNYIR